MNNYLIYFALPIATIILAIVVEKLLRDQIFTGLTFFAIYLIVTFGIFDVTFLVYAIIYTLLAFLSAYIAELFFNKRVLSNNISNIEVKDNNCDFKEENMTTNIFDNMAGNRYLRYYRKKY